MLRAVALAARLGFTIDRDTVEAIRSLRGEIVRSSPARVLEEIYKILRQGRRRDLPDAASAGLLTYLLPRRPRRSTRAGRRSCCQPLPPRRVPQRGWPPGGPHQPDPAGHAARAPGRAPASPARRPSRRRPEEEDEEEPETEAVDVAAEAEALGEEEDPRTGKPWSTSPRPSLSRGATSIACAWPCWPNAGCVRSTARRGSRTFCWAVPTWTRPCGGSRSMAATTVPRSRRTGASWSDRRERTRRPHDHDHAVRSHAAESAAAERRRLPAGPRFDRRGRARRSPPPPAPSPRPSSSPSRHDPRLWTAERHPLRP